MNFQQAQQQAQPEPKKTNDALLNIETAVKIAALHTLLIFGGLLPFALWFASKNYFMDWFAWILGAWALAFVYFVVYLWRWNNNIMTKEVRDGVDYSRDGKLGRKRVPTLHVKVEWQDGADVVDTGLEENSKNLIYLQNMAKAFLAGRPTSQVEMKRIYKMPQGVWKRCIDALEQLNLVRKENSSRNAKYVIVNTKDQPEKVSREVLGHIASGNFEILEEAWSTAPSPSAR